MPDRDRLPDGTRFPLWDDRTVYSREYYVAVDAPGASDDNEGTRDRPLRTIGAAAQRLQPGEKAVIHGGVYRECIRPPRGGDAPERMIAYEAAPGETVVISAAELWTPAACPSSGWRIPPLPDGRTVWMADLPEDIFRAYNPFLARNAYDHLYCYGQMQDAAWLQRALLRRGAVFLDRTPLRQVFFAHDLAAQDGAFWVEEPGLRLHFRLPGDLPPEQPLEISAREQTFSPEQEGLGFLRVSGLVMRHAADGLPVPQRGSLSTRRGHHWIVEDCTVEWANGVGMSIGAESWNAQELPGMGHHIIRRNRIRHCGVCGIAGARGVCWTLLEENCFEHIGHQDLERMYECAGIKFHFARNTLVRDNVFRHLQHAGGIWLDVDNINNRITGNVFADIGTVTAAIYSELNYEPNLIDHNLLWDVRGTGIHADCNECVIVAHNLIGRLGAGGAIRCSLGQAARQSSGRTGLCRANQVINNIVLGARPRVEFGRREENVSDGNLYAVGDDNCSFHLHYPEPGCYQDLASWQRFFGLDLHSTQATVHAAFDPESLLLTLSVNGSLPECRQREWLEGQLTHPEPGPLATDAWERLRRGPVAMGCARWRCG